MNKTVSINLGGFFFHIDEDAYQKINRYFDAIRRSLSPDGKDEIMSDIEARIAELLTEKLKNDKQVVGQREIDEVIAIMGQPEDYKIDDDMQPAGNPSSSYAGGYAAPGYAYVKNKKFYRDEEAGRVGGVCAGLAHYFRIDPLWIRIIFVASLFLSFGTSLFVYVLLWILIPRAITTAEKLEMRGEPINISNIEKKVKEEFNQVADKIQNIDYDRLGANVKSGAEKVGDGLSYVFSNIFKIIGKVIGAIIALISAIMLGSLIVTFIMILFSSSMEPFSWYPYVKSMNHTNTPLALVATVVFFALAIPLFSLFMLGLKILSDNLRSLGDTFKYSLLAVWIVSVTACIYLGLYQASQFSSEGKVVVKKEINIFDTDTLNIKFSYNDYFAKSVRHEYDFSFEQDSAGNQVLYSNDVKFYILKTDERLPYIQIEKISRAGTIGQARKSAEGIKYNFKIDGNNLILDNYLLTGSDEFSNQHVEIYLYLPKGTYFKPDASVKEYDESDDNFFNLWHDDDKYVYQMDSGDVKCLNCVEPLRDESGNIIPPPQPTSEVLEQQQQILKDQAEQLKQQAEDMKQQAEQMTKDARQMEKDAKGQQNTKP